MKRLSAVERPHRIIGLWYEMLLLRIFQKICSLHDIRRHATCSSIDSVDILISKLINNAEPLINLISSLNNNFNLVLNGQSRLLGLIDMANLLFSDLIPLRSIRQFLQCI